MYAVAIVGFITNADRDAAALGIGQNCIHRTFRIDFVTIFHSVAKTRGGATGRGRRLHGILRTIGTEPGAGLQNIAHSDGIATQYAHRLELIDGTGRRRTRTILRLVANAGRGPAFQSRLCIIIVRTRGGCPGAVFGNIAQPGDRTAFFRIRRVLISGTSLIRSVAVLREVTGAGHRPAFHGGRLDLVRRTCICDAVAIIALITNIGRWPALHAGGGYLIDRAIYIDAIAVIRDITGAGNRPAFRRRGLYQVGRTIRPITRAHLRHIADTLNRPALDGGRSVGIGWADDAETGAKFRDVASTGDRPAFNCVGLIEIAGTILSRSRTIFRRIA